MANSTLSGPEQIAVLEKGLMRQMAWISAADSKITFTFAIDMALLGFLAAISPKLPNMWSVAPALCAFFATLLGLASLFFLSLASFPRTKGPKSSLVYFGGIVHRDIDQFRKAILELSVESYTEDLSAQCHRNAEIADRKFVWVQRAMIALYAAVIPWILAIYLLYRVGG